jgi:peptidoglycan/xylan/chitin deacetylase (PgdA/CDA1 family)
LPSSARARVVVLCYHSIHPTLWIACASPELFEQHLQWLSSECECVPFSDIHRRAVSRSPGKPVVAVTFDDGYADNHEIALPLLEKWSVPATFFVTSGLIDMDPAVVERFRFLYPGRSHDEWRPMTWSQVQELRDAGMEIGSHTHRHSNLALLSPDQARAELRRSKDELEDRLGREVSTLAYPFGKPRRHVIPEIAKIAGEVGFRSAGLVLHRAVRRSDDPLQIPRFTVVDDPIDKLTARVRGAFDVVGFGQEHGPLWAAKLISPEDFRFGT